MDRNAWLGKLDLLHAKKRGGEPLEAEDLAWYTEARGLLVTAALARYNEWLPSAEKARSAVRIERALPLVLDGSGGVRRAVTVDVGAGGFAALLDEPPTPGVTLRARLTLPDGDLVANVTASFSSIRGGAHRVSFVLSHGDAEARARLEDFLLDELLPKLVFWDDVLDRLRL
jgi:hypothetical protein